MTSAGRKERAPSGASSPESERDAVRPESVAQADSRLSALPTRQSRLRFAKRNEVTGAKWTQGDTRAQPLPPQGALEGNLQTAVVKPSGPRGRR